MGHTLVRHCCEALRACVHRVPGSVLKNAANFYSKTRYLAERFVSVCISSAIADFEARIHGKAVAGSARIRVWKSAMAGNMHTETNFSITCRLFSLKIDGAVQDATWNTINTSQRASQQERQRVRIRQGRPCVTGRLNLAHDAGPSNATKSLINFMTWRWISRRDRDLMLHRRTAGAHG